MPYAQVNQDGEEIDLNGAVLLPAVSPYAEPWLLAGPTPVSPFYPPSPPPPPPVLNATYGVSAVMLPWLCCMQLSLHVAKMPCPSFWVGV